MVKIRLRRVGAKKQPSYRVVVADSRSPRNGRFIEVVGFYNPRTEPETVTIQEDRALHWLSVGAQPTEAVHRLLQKQGTLDRFERLKQGEPLDALVAEAAAQVTQEELAVEPETEPFEAQDDAETDEAGQEGEEPSAPVEQEAETEAIEE